MLRARAGVELWIFLRQLFLSGDFQPDGFCYRWNSGLVWLNVCGMTHVMEVWNLWHAQYWLAGIIKTITPSLPFSLPFSSFSLRRRGRWRQGRAGPWWRTIWAGGGEWRQDRGRAF